MKPGTTTPRATTSPATAVPSIGNKGKAQGKGKRATMSQATTTTPPQPEQQIVRQPAYRHLTKSPQQLQPQYHIQGDVKATADYWIREGRFWKRAHVQPRTAF